MRTSGPYRSGSMATALLLAGGLLAACGSGGEAADAAEAAEPERVAIDVSRLGPQVGETVPDFSLPDQNGETRDLESILGPEGGMLVFVRSADW